MANSVGAAHPRTIRQVRWPVRRAERPWLGRLLAVGLCEAVGIGGAIATDTGDSPWYRSLRKPRANPPAWVFAPVWTVLYAMMGLAGYELWRSRDIQAGRSALLLFGVQLALNAAWTPVFFGRHSLRGGLAVIVALWGSILLLIGRAARLSTVAASLLIPYFAWVSFATYLNARIVALNPASSPEPWSHRARR